MKLINFILFATLKKKNLPKTQSWNGKTIKGDTVGCRGSKVIWQLESLPRFIFAKAFPISGVPTLKDVGYVVSSWIRNPRPGGLVV